MTKKKAKNQKPRPRPKVNLQIPNSLARQLASTGLSNNFEHAREYPIYGCWLTAEWKEEGITPVVIAREQTPGKLLVASYMVDLFCLGIKDVVVKTDYSISKFERDLPKFCAGNPLKCSVELAHEIVYGGLEYAAKLGFEPHPDFHKGMADLILDPPDAHTRVDKVEFGKNGKPFYITGPYDDAKKIMFITQTLTRTCGEGNFDVLMMGNLF
jgi:hypothetical protein